jgi:uncharacterized protein YaiE (UPF0345 family)
MFKVNEYFEGKVKSIAFKTTTCPATVGVMAVGEYVFGTSSIEHMTLISGKMQVKLPQESVFKNIKINETFIVEANVKFAVKIEEESAYLCLYK